MKFTLGFQSGSPQQISQHRPSCFSIDFIQTTTRQSTIGKLYLRFHTGPLLWYLLEHPDDISTLICLPFPKELNYFNIKMLGMSSDYVSHFTVITNMSWHFSCLRYINVTTFLLTFVTTLETCLDIFKYFVEQDKWHTPWLTWWIGMPWVCHLSCSVRFLKYPNRFQMLQQISQQNVTFSQPLG